MIQRIIGGAVGALVTIAILWWNHVPVDVSAMAAIAGAVAAFIWPVVIGWYLIRRGRKRRDAQVEAEVAKQMAQQQQR